MNREEAVRAVLQGMPGDAYLITTTGLISREVFAQGDRDRNLYLLGSMGLASSIGLGLALMNEAAPIVVLEGDGSALMSLGVLPSIAAERPARFAHIILDNEAYESTGGQRSVSSQFSLADAGRAAGYAYSSAATDSGTLREAMRAACSQPGPNLVLAKVRLDPALRVPPRISLSPAEIRDRFRRIFSSENRFGSAK